VTGGATSSGLTRRRVLAAGAAGAGALWLPDAVREANAASQRRVPVARGGEFDTGIASGDPTPRAVTLWSRLAGIEQRRVRVRLVVAEDEDFRRVVLNRLVPVTAVRDHTVKVRVGRLKPDTRYWFRFATRGATSPVGRTQTAPPPDSLRPIRIGYFSCQDFTSGYYGAYRRLLDLDPDVVVCGGDYIYDRIYVESGYGKARPDRTGRNKDGTAVTIEDYRAKYRLCRSDPDLRELHRLVPLVAQWDDHEVTDNYVGTLERSGADDGDPQDVYDRARILAGWRAWHEYMPALRYRGNNGFRTFRRLRFGRSVDLFMLDSRSYRDDQPCNGVGAAPCADSAQPRRYLGAGQLGWLKDRLFTTDAQWKIVANQLMIMPFDLVPFAPVEVDSWQGYEAERTDLTTYLLDKGIHDVVFLTGDIHTFYAGEVRQFGRSGPPVAVEIVGGSTTSPGTAEFISNNAGGGALPPDQARLITDNTKLVNPWFSFATTREHGFAFVEASTAGLTAELHASRDVLTPAGSRSVRRLVRMGVAPGVPGLTIE
jgi:alkaline phosphatase D